MKIAIDVSQIAYENTGVGVYTRNLIRSLLELGTEHEFIFYAGVLRQKDRIYKYVIDDPFSKGTWKVRPLPPKIANLIFNRTSIPIDPLIGEFDIFHASDWTFPKTFKPAVTTVHDLVFYKYPETQEALIIKTMVNRMNRVISKASHIIVDSKSTKNDMVSDLGVERSRMTTVHLAADENFKPSKKSDISDLLKKLDIEAPYILILGTMEPRKNISKAIDAFKVIKKQKKYKDYKLVIAGRHGWGQKPVASHKDIKIIGEVRSRDLPALYSGSDIFLYPSLYEGFGLPVLEAMSCGVPVVTSDRSSLEEIVAQSGVTVDPTKVKDIAEGIEKALRRKEHYTKESLSRSKDFSWEKAAQKTLNVYEQTYKANYS